MTSYYLYNKIAINTGGTVQSTIWGNDQTGSGFIGTLSNHAFQVRQNNVAKLTIDTSGNATFAGKINTADATDSTSGSTGSIYTAGGVGITKALFVGTSASIGGSNTDSGIGIGMTRTANSRLSLTHISNNYGESYPVIDLNWYTAGTYFKSFMDGSLNTIFKTYAVGGGTGNLLLTTAGNTQVTSTTATTSSTTGALTVAGGLGVAGSGYFSNSILLHTPVAQQKTWHSAITPLQIGMLGSMMAFNGTSTDAWMNISRNMYVNSSGVATYMYGTNAASFELGSLGATISVAPVGTADTAITWTPALKVNIDATLSVAKLTTSTRTGISSPITGSMVYDSDLNLFYYYNGSSWTSFGTGTGHSQLHSMTSTADHSAGNWKVFYSDGSGHVIELGMGSSGQVLQSNGASAAPTWVTPATGSGGGYTVVSKTGNYSAATTDQVILCDTSGGAFTITLPAASTSSGVNYRVIKTDSSTNAVTIQGNASETINGSNTQVFNTQYDSVQVVCSGSAWFIM